MGHEEGAHAASKDGAGDGLSDHPQAVYTPPPTLDKALADFSKAVELAPGNPNAYRMRGIGYLWTKNYEKAVIDFSKAIELNPRDVEHYVGRGDAYYHIEKYDKALPDYESACQLAPKNVEALLGRARTLNQLKNWDKALADYRHVIQMDPKNVKSHWGLAGIFRRRGEFDEARAAYAEALKLDPENAGVLEDFASFLASCPKAKMRDGEKALQYAKKACDLKQGGDSRSFQIVAAAHAELGNFAEAVEWQKKALKEGAPAGKKMPESAERLKLYEDKKPYREVIKP